MPSAVTDQFKSMDFCINLDQPGEKLLGPVPIRRDVIMQQWDFEVDPASFERYVEWRTNPEKPTLPYTKEYLLPRSVRLFIIVDDELPAVTEVQPWNTSRWMIKLNDQLVHPVFSGKVKKRQFLDITRFISEGTNNLKLLTLRHPQFSKGSTGSAVDYIDALPPYQLQVQVTAAIHFNEVWAEERMHLRDGKAMVATNILKIFEETTPRGVDIEDKVGKELAERTMKDGRGPRGVSTPFKGFACEHLESLDFKSWIEFHRSERDPSWACPFCSKDCSPLNGGLDVWMAESILKDQPDEPKSFWVPLASRAPSPAASSQSHHRQQTVLGALSSSLQTRAGEVQANTVIRIKTESVEEDEGLLGT